MYRTILISICLIFLSGCTAKVASTIVSEDSSTVLTIGEAQYSVEIKDTIQERKQGLSGRTEMLENEGMLFLFDTAQDRHFWMKDMHFPLDFVWIENNVIVGLSKDIPHPAINDGQIARISSPKPADAVLEIHAGQIDQYGIKVGDLVNY